MNTHYPITDGAVTPEYVLSVLGESHRQQCHFDPEADPEMTLTFDSTVADWRTACDLVGWRQLGRAMNASWNMNCSDQEWRAVLTPAKSKTLADVCHLIATHAVAPRIRSTKLFGCSCRPAAVFLTVRSLLHDAGAEAYAIRPSTPLSDYTRKYLDTFLGPISRLAPGALPDMMETRFSDALVLMIGMSFVLPLSVGSVVSSDSLFLGFAILLCIVSSFLMWLAARYIYPSKVEFGDLQTFRDLAHVVADHVLKGQA